MHMTERIEGIPYMPGSRYAAELQNGARDMRFPPALEREYHLFYLAERRSHVRFFNAVMGVLLLIALLASLLLSHENAAS
jgi:hypothetical protein